MLRKQKNKQQKQQHFSTVIKDFEEKPYLVYKNQSQSTSVLSPSLMMEKSSASRLWVSPHSREVCWMNIWGKIVRFYLHFVINYSVNSIFGPSSDRPL